MKNGRKKRIKCDEKGFFKKIEIFGKMPRKHGISLDFRFRTAPEATGKVLYQTTNFRSSYAKQRYRKRQKCTFQLTPRYIQGAAKVLLPKFHKQFLLAFCISAVAFRFVALLFCVV